MKTDISPLWNWINERHAIHVRRLRGDPWPWTDDLVLRNWSFTNVFRELDRGTVALRKMCGRWSGPDLLFNIIWYRAFNRAELAEVIGFVQDFDRLERRLRELKADGVKLWTGAHMTWGGDGIRDRLDIHIAALRHAWEDRHEAFRQIHEGNSIRRAFEVVQRYECVGPFIAYEIATDLRMTSIHSANDALTWANVGPGAAKGLRELGLEPDLRSMRYLWNISHEHLGGHVMEHHPRFTDAQGGTPSPHPFELREIEHSLCETYKWIKAGRGKRLRRRFHFHPEGEKDYARLHG